MNLIVNITDYQPNNWLYRCYFVVSLLHRMGNTYSSSGDVSVSALFDRNILRCNHSPRLELDIPSHVPCGTCCRCQPCAEHDETPANHEMVAFKNYMSRIVRFNDVHDVAVQSSDNPLDVALQRVLTVAQRHTPGVDQPGVNDVTLLLYQGKFLMCIISLVQIWAYFRINTMITYISVFRRTCKYEYDGVF